MLNIRQSLKFSFFLVFAFLLISIQKVNAAALACNAVTEVSQTFSFDSTTNTWPSGTLTKSFGVGTAPNNVNLTFTINQLVTPITGDPSLRTYGNVANSLTISSNGGLASNTLIATLGLAPSRAINKLSYSIYDSDYYNSGGFNFRDRTISTSSAGNPTTITAQNGTNETISGNTTTATTSADCGANDANCNLYFAYNLNGITSASTQFYAAHASGTSTQQAIAFSQYAWCLPRMPTVKVQKITTGHTGAGGTFTFADTNLTGTIASIITTAPSTATPASPTALPATTINTDVTITETPASGFALSSATCTDANSGSTGNPASFGSLAGNVLTIPATNMRAGADITCTFTNRKTAQLTLRKTWTNAKVNDAVTVTTAGGTVNPSFASVANSANETDTGTATTVFAGETLTFTEPFSVGSAANYNASLSCTGATDTNLANGLTINAADSNITCTYTNTRKSATLRLAKAWGANSISGNVANIGATTGGTNNTTAFTSTASTATNSATVTVYAGDTLTLPAETMSTGTLANYTTSLSCDNGVTPSGSNGQSSNTVSIPNTFSGLITCTYTNTRKSATLRLAKAWGANSIAGNVANIGATTGGTNNTTAFTSTASTSANSATVTVYAGDTLTLPAETMSTGTLANYTTSLSCDNGVTPSGSNGQSSNTVSIPNTFSGLITCTYTNTRKSATLRLAKAWGANSIAGNVANIGATTGLLNNTTALTSTASTNTNGTAVTVYAGETATLPAETMSTGTLANYTTTLSCDNGVTPSGSNGQSSNTISIPNTFSGLITCTYTNTRKSATLRLAKAWGANSIAGNVANIGATTGLLNNTTALTSTASTNTNGTAVTVYAGETATLPAETMSTGTLANYTTTLSCDNGVTPSGTNGQSSNTITIPNTVSSLITCTYTNTRKSATLRLAKAWGANSISGNVANIGATTGLINNTSALTSTASTNTNGTAVTVFAGETATLPAETMSTGTLANYTTTLSCDNGVTPSGTNGQSSNTISIPNTVSGLITCTYTNMRIAQNLTLAKQWTNGVNGHTANVTTTGGINNATVSSTSTGNNTTTGTAVTVYADEVITLPVETFGGGASASDYNTTLSCTGGSTLANGAVGRSVTISNSAAATTCTYTNAKLPTITITKITNGGVGSFDFTGTNGFANQTITTVSSGVGVAGATQRLTAAGVVTQITENTPYGFALTNVSCSGLGTGTATVNYDTSTVTLDANATAAANNIACTFTNTAYGVTPTDPLLKTTRFSAVPDVPTIVQGSSGTQTIVMTNHGPDDATNVVVYYRPLLATGVSVTSVSSPAGACTFSSPDWVCPAIASVLNGASFNISVTYSTTNASSLGIAQQGEIRVNSNEYTECGGVNEYKYNVWGSGGTTQPQPAPTNSAFWVGNTNTTTTATPSGAYSTESTDIFQAWPTNQDSPTGSYLYSPVAGTANNIYTPSSTTANPTVSKVLTGLNGQPENNVLLPAFGSTGTFTGDNKRAWEGQTCIYVPVATTVTPCLTMFDDAAYISVKNINTGVTTVAAGQSSWNPGSVLSGSVAVSSGYYVIKARISNRNTNGGNSEDGQGGYGQLAGIGSATCSTADLDALAQNAVPQSINIVAPATITLSKISQDGTGSFNFNGNNGFGTQTITTVTSGVAVTASTKTLSAVALATTITETIPSGYTVTDISCSGLGAGGTTTLNLPAGSVVLDAAAVASGANISCTFTNTASAYSITGKVFLDNGKNAATPHNGLLEADETGLGNITVQLTDCAATVHQTALTNGAGAYSLAIPNGLLAGATVCVVEQPSSNLISVSGVAGNTGGAYSLAQHRTQFTLSAATNYTGVDFGNVVDSQLTSTGSQTIAAGTTASYSHQFISGTEGLVTFSTAQAPTPALTWTSLVYIDTNCNALLDGGDIQVTAPVAVLADQVLCLLQKVQSPSTAANGSQDVSTISASFAFSAPSAITRLYNQDDTTIIMDSGLVLVKKVRSVSSCPSTGADVNPFVTNNQALPNSLIEYQITYSNPSSGVVSDVVINDMTPAFTTFRSASCASTPSSVLCSVGTSPTLGATGAISWPLANNPTGLTSGQSGDVRFCVRVDQ